MPYRNTANSSTPNLGDLLQFVVNQARGMWRYRWYAVVVVWLLCLAGCEPEEQGLTIDPPSASRFGYVPITIELPADGPAILSANHVGYLDFAGNLDLAIAIRTAVRSRTSSYWSRVIVRPCLLLGDRQAAAKGQFAHAPQR